MFGDSVQAQLAWAQSRVPARSPWLSSPELTCSCLPSRRHIENWRGLHTLNAVDMELYTGLQKL